MSGAIEIGGVLTGVQELVERLAGANARLHTDLKSEIVRITGRVEAGAKENVSGLVLGIRSGDLLASVNSQIVEGAAFLKGVIGSTEIHGAAWEYGFEHGRIGGFLRKDKKDEMFGWLSSTRQAAGTRKEPARQWLRPPLADRKQEILLVLGLVAENAI